MTASPGSSSNLLVRAFRKGDRDKVRHICCETADAGSPVDSFFPDRALFADFWTLYYTDFEPASSFVAEMDGRVVGYLTGALSARRAAVIMAALVGPLIFVRGLFRGSFFRPYLYALVWQNGMAGFFSKRRSLPLPKGTAGELHINLLPECRGAGLGAKLVQAFLTLAQAREVSTVVAAVRADSRSARRFFEGQGFVCLGERFGYRVMTPAVEDYDVAVFVKNLISVSEKASSGRAQ